MQRSYSSCNGLRLDSAAVPFNRSLMNVLMHFSALIYMTQISELSTDPT